MRLKSLELFGFKSFVERTILTFEEGITSIVGPNGCGKSNVVDAIRWAMGEQSAKHLRGSEMLDVIFNGTATREPINMAQVTLTFDVTDGRAPAGYGDYSEIQIERRLYRTGESEYYINKVPCRLRDIVDLFLGTGVGTKAYSIIEQGRIGQILTSKAEERRLLIEEAAGISKFKNRKEVALRKIEATEANLARLSDIIGEIKRQLGSLDRQARKAEKYKKVFDELRTCELGLAGVRYQRLKTEVDRLEVENNDLTQTESGVGAELATQETSQEERRLDLTTLEQNLNQTQEQLYTAQNTVKLLEAGIRFKESRIREIAVQAETYTGEIESFRTKLRQEEAELEKINQEKLSADLTLGSLVEEVKTLETRYQEIQGEQKEVQAQLELERNQILGCVSQSTEAQSRLEHLEHSEIEISGRLAKGEAQVDAVDKRRKEIERKILATQKDLGDLKQLRLKLTSEESELKQMLETKRKELKESEERLEERRHALAAKRSRLTSLEDLRRNREGLQEGVRTVLKRVEENGEALKGVVGTVSELIDTDPSYSRAVGAALGDKLQYVVVESQTQGVEAVEYLKQVAKGRSAFIPMQIRSEGLQTKALEGPGVVGPILDFVRFSDDYRSIAQYLFGDVVLVEDLRKALSLWQEKMPAKTLVTLEGEVIDPQGVISGGTAVDGEFLLGQKNQIESLQKDVGATRAVVAEYEKEALQIKAQVHELEQQLEAIHQDNHGGEIRLVNQEKDVHHWQNELNRYDQERDRLSIDIARCVEEKQEIQSNREKAIEHLEGATVRQEEFQKKVRELESGLERLGRELELANTNTTDRKIALAQSQERVANIDREIRQLVKTKVELQEGIERRISEINQGQLLAQNLKGEVETDRHQLAGSLQSVEELSVQQRECQSAYQTAQSAILEHQVTIRDIRRRHDELTRLLHETGMKLTDLKGELRFLMQGILERYHVDLGVWEGAGVRECEGAEYNEEAEAQKVAELKEQLEKLGSVHVGAVEEYEELKNRHEFLSKQQTDLLQSLESLKKTIQKINRTSRERFLETFEKVNEKFQEIFPRLFRGGRAKLLLIDEENLLESGVEIFAQPPGKKLQSITLLSGGEKALTAVALIFAIFLTKPSPFCLLDEVDAPLDEANVDRFNDMIRQMTSHSQFMIITHNKRTMERADVLYGITMEERGVSKVVSVKLEGMPAVPATKASAVA